MEWMKNMGLKKSFFLLSALSIVTALLMVGLVFLICEKITSTYPKGGMLIDYDGVVRELASPTDRQELIMDIVGWVEFFSCILIPVGCVSVASFLFYHGKLKKPIEVLQTGTERIREHDLAFSIPKVSGDELGQVCAAFETMREELLQTNQELWRQAEERKRLNAAFSHDLRNPVTVLKGTVKLLRQGTADEHALERMETYVLRLEQYVEAMSGVQRLEQISVQKKEVELSTLRDELAETARMLAPGIEARVCVFDVAPEIEVNEGTSGKVDIGQEYGMEYVRRHSQPISKTDKESVTIDHGLFLTVAENLIGNAARYAVNEIAIFLSVWTCQRYSNSENEIFLEMCVVDDGCGYPEKLIEEGPKPFGRMEEDAAHFGMGLYTSRMLCAKHGGELILENEIGAGARATARFRVTGL